MNTDPVVKNGLAPLRTIAQTGDRFGDFAPYVASIDEDGTVAFQAALVGGGACICDGDAQLVGPFESHPAIASGRLCAYAAGQLVLVEDGQQRVVSGDLRVGPLGPTMNEDGVIAFRAGGAIYRFRDGSVETVATGGAYHGLPVVKTSGSVVYRSDRGIHIDDTLVVKNAEHFGELGHFPSANDAGTIVFTSPRGVFTTTGGGISTVVDQGFESYRGALIDDAGRVVFYATPPGGQLGIYRGAERLLAIGDTYLGSTITEFALNPVSINRRGDLALRLRLADDRQVIVATA